MQNDLDMSVVYDHVKSKTPRQILKRSLTELSQKYTLDCTRKMSKVFMVDGVYYCPCSLHRGNKRFTRDAGGKRVKVRLQRAHVGVRRCDIIESVLDEYPKETNIIFLLDKVMFRHKDITLQLVCQSCNKKLENKKPRL